jgi:SAM-dependent methyltransferase
MVRERRKRLWAMAEGRVLDLTGRAQPGDCRRADAVSGPDAPDDRGGYDTVVSVMCLSGADDPAVMIDQLRDVLAPGGILLFLEPVREPGIGRFGQRLVSPALQRAAGWRVDRDIPALLRSAGWTIPDLERIDMPRYLWPLHGFVEGRAGPRPEADA